MSVPVAVTVKNNDADSTFRDGAFDYGGFLANGTSASLQRCDLVDSASSAVTAAGDASLLVQSSTFSGNGYDLHPADPDARIYVEPTNELVVSYSGPIGPQSGGEVLPADRAQSGTFLRPSSETILQLQQVRAAVYALKRSCGRLFAAVCAADSCATR